MKKNMKTEAPNFELIKENTIEGHICTCSLYTDSKSTCRCGGGSCKCARKSFLPITQMKKGQSCKIAYINSEKCGKSHQILSLLPGSEVKIVQTSPSPVFQIENLQIGIDSTIADSIYVNNLE